MSIDLARGDNNRDTLSAVCRECECTSFVGDADAKFCGSCGHSQEQHASPEQESSVASKRWRHRNLLLGLACLSVGAVFAAAALTSGGTSSPSSGKTGNKSNASKASTVKEPTVSDGSTERCDDFIDEEGVSRSVDVEEGSPNCADAEEALVAMANGEASFVFVTSNADSYYRTNNGWECPVGRHGSINCKEGTSSVRSRVTGCPDSQVVAEVEVDSTNLMCGEIEVVAKELGQESNSWKKGFKVRSEMWQCVWESASNVVCEDVVTNRGKWSGSLLPVAAANTSEDCPPFGASGIDYEDGAGYADISVRGISCADVKPLIMNGTYDSSGTFAVPGWTCKPLSGGFESAGYRCQDTEQRAFRFVTFA